MSCIHRHAAWLPAAGLLTLLLAGSFWRASQPLPGGAVALIFPPWWSDAQIVDAAAEEGQIIRIGLWHGVVVIHPDASGSGPNGGAWLRLNPMIAGCGDVA